MRPHFTGTFVLQPRRPAKWWHAPEFDFLLDATDPLTWHDGGTAYQPDQHFVTDGGSIPRVVQLIPALDAMRFPKSYAFHDSSYRHHWIFERRAHEINMHRVRITRAQADEMLCRMIRAEGGTIPTARTVYRAVRLFGWACW